jgi:hypothetical protein
MSTNVEAEIRAKTETFAKELAALVRRAAIEATAAALGVGGTAAAPATAAPARRRGHPEKVATPAPVAKAPSRAGGKPSKVTKAAPAAKAPVSKKTQRAPGEKRPPAELAKLTARLGDYIKANPGQRMEAIGKALGTPTKELNLPINKLLAAKKIKTQGQKRATEYFPA